MYAVVSLPDKLTCTVLVAINKGKVPGFESSKNVYPSSESTSEPFATKFGVLVHCYFQEQGQGWRNLSSLLGQV